MTWHWNVALRSTSPRKSIKERKKEGPREAEERGDVRKRKDSHEFVSFDSPGAETLDVSESLPEKQHDGVILILGPARALEPCHPETRLTHHTGLQYLIVVFTIFV